MAESLALSESGLDKPEDIPEGENQFSDPESEATRKRKIRSSTGSPSPKGENPPQPQRVYNRNLSKISDFGVPPSVEKLALQGQVSNSPFLNKVPITMDGNLEMPPKSIKPYRDYLDRDYIKEESPTCAAVTYTMDKLTMEDTSVKFEGFTETFNMTLRRHLREESQIILLRNVVNDTFTTEMRTAHANSEIFEGKKRRTFSLQ